MLSTVIIYLYDQQFYHNMYLSILSLYRETSLYKYAITSSHISVFEQKQGEIIVISISYFSVLEENYYILFDFSLYSCLSFVLLSKLYVVYAIKFQISNCSMCYTSHYRGWLYLMATSRQPAHFEISHLFLSALSVMRNKEKL